MSSETEKSNARKNNMTVTLELGIPRGEQTLSAIHLRRPKAGELRGISITELIHMDTAAYIKLIPRISEPTLTEFEVAQLDPADIVKIATLVLDFLVPKSQKAGDS